MEFMLKVGMSKKVGMPNFGSFGAECALEIPVNIGTLGNPEEFDRLIAQSYAKCLESVDGQIRIQTSPQPVVQSPVPQEKPKASPFGAWLKDQAVAYGQDMATITGLLYRHLFPQGKSTVWTDQGKELAVVWNELHDETQKPTVFDKYLSNAFTALDSSDDVA